MYVVGKIHLLTVLKRNVIEILYDEITVSVKNLHGTDSCRSYILVTFAAS